MSIFAIRVKVVWTSLSSAQARTALVSFNRALIGYLTLLLSSTLP
jgi:hypothetical protein